MKTSYIKISAILTIIILIGLGVFQFLLILGLPLGHSVWGGTHRVLPIHFRIGSLISIVIYVIAIYAILIRAGMSKKSPNLKFARIGTWTFSVIFLLSGLLNIASISFWERYIMAPLAIILGILFLLIAKYKTSK